MLLSFMYLNNIVNFTYLYMILAFFCDHTKIKYYNVYRGHILNAEKKGEFFSFLIHEMHIFSFTDN